MTELISPVAIGLISDPPTIVVSYDYIPKIPREGQKRKRRKRKMPLRDFTDRSNVKRYAFNLRQRHTKYLADVLDVTLEKMLRMIQEIQKGNSVERSLDIVNKEYSIDPNEDLNKLSPAQLAQRKAVMDEIFRKNLVKPDDPNFVYDLEMSFEPKNEKNEGNDWDEDVSEKVESKNGAFIIGNPTELTLPFEAANEISSPLRITEKSAEELTSPQLGTMAPQSCREDQVEKVTEIKIENIRGGDSTTNAESTNQLLASFAEVQIRSSFLPESNCDEKAIQGQDNESSSNNDIEEALENIESGTLDNEEDEDFWA